jgi:plasmid stability protein
VKVTIAFSDDELYRRIRVHAAASGRQIRDIVEEALAAWLEQAEEAADVAASAAALEEYQALGGTEADAFFTHMINEGRVSYESD